MRVACCNTTVGDRDGATSKLEDVSSAVWGCTPGSTMRHGDPARLHGSALKEAERLMIWRDRGGVMGAGKMIWPLEAS